MASPSDITRQPPNFICDASGFKLPQTEMVRQWDGAYVGRRFRDIRNPQDFVRGVRDDMSLQVARPEQVDAFITTPVTQDDL